MRIASLNVYPMKSARGIAVEASRVRPTGLEHDREVMVVDDQGQFLTQREHPELARVGARIEGRRLSLEFEDRRVAVSLDGGGEELDVVVWGDQCRATDLGAEASAFVTAALGAPTRVVRLANDFQRPVKAGYGAAGDNVSFADAFPFLVASVASLEAVVEHHQGGAPPTMQRFRPNLVVDGCGPFEEDTWQTIRVGEIILDLVKPCARCAIVDVDPARGVRDPGTLKTLASFRTTNNKTYFGMNGIPRKLGTVRVGDAVTVSKTKD